MPNFNLMPNFNPNAQLKTLIPNRVLELYCTWWSFLNWFELKFWFRLFQAFQFITNQLRDKCVIQEQELAWYLRGSNDSQMMKDKKW